jgi:hypothetical protein
VLTPTLRCREISATDLDTVTDLLTPGFVGRSREYWMQGLRRGGTIEGRSDTDPAGAIWLSRPNMPHDDPFILLPMPIRRGWIAPAAMRLVYCRDIAEFVECAGAIGRALIWHGRKYFKVPYRHRLADLTDVELVLYGP